MKKNLSDEYWDKLDHFATVLRNIVDGRHKMTEAERIRTVNSKLLMHIAINSNKLDPNPFLGVWSVEERYSRHKNDEWIREEDTYSDDKYIWEFLLENELIEYVYNRMDYCKYFDSTLRSHFPEKYKFQNKITYHYLKETETLVFEQDLDSWSEDRFKVEIISEDEIYLYPLEYSNDDEISCEYKIRIVKRPFKIPF